MARSVVLWPAELERSHNDNASRHVSPCVARTHWLRSCASPLRYSANRVQRGESHGGLLVPIYTNFNLRHTPRQCATFHDPDRGCEAIPAAAIHHGTLVILTASTAPVR